MKTLKIALAFVALMSVTFPAKASDLLSFGVGYFDINKQDDDATDFRAEYRWDEPFWWVVKPWAGVEATSDGAIYGLGGVLIDWDISEHWVVTPSFGAGLYADGDGKDLGHAIEFRSQLEVGYQFQNNSRLGLAFGHISNASIGDKNPGTEILNLYYHVPVDWFR